MIKNHHVEEILIDRYWNALRDVAALTGRDATRVIQVTREDVSKMLARVLELAGEVS